MNCVIRFFKDFMIADHYLYKTKQNNLAVKVKKLKRLRYCKKNFVRTMIYRDIYTMGVEFLVGIKIKISENMFRKNQLAAIDKHCIEASLGKVNSIFFKSCSLIPFSNPNTSKLFNVYVWKNLKKSLKTRFSVLCTKLSRYVVFESIKHSSVIVARVSNMAHVPLTIILNISLVF